MTARSWNHGPVTPRSDGDDLERAFREADASDDDAVHLAFKDRLLASHDEAALSRHFEFLRRARNHELRQRLARFFVWHGTSALAFLERATRTEESPRDRATSVQILGMLGQRHRETKARALRAIEASLDDPDETVRERAVMALGWVGSSKHVARLVDLLLATHPPAVRAMAATQLVLLAASNARDRSRALAAVAPALLADPSPPPDVRDALVDAAESLGRKRFGPKSDRDGRATRALRALAPEEVTRRGRG